MGNSDIVKVFVQSPCEALRPFVKRFLVVEFLGAHKHSHFPDTGLVAGFCFRGRCMLDAKTMAPQTGLAGLWDRNREAEQNGNTGMVFAAFTPTGAAALLRRPMDEFFNGVVGLHDVLDGSTELNRVHEKIGEAPNHARRVQALENFLVQRATNAQVESLFPLQCRRSKQPMESSALSTLPDMLVFAKARWSGAFVR